MIERYTLPEMGAVWSEQAKFQSWLDVEIAATEANCRLGRVPQEALDTIKAKASFEVERILTDCTGSDNTAASNSAVIHARTGDAVDVVSG